MTESISDTLEQLFDSQSSRTPSRPENQIDQEELELATTVILMELANADQDIDHRELNVIKNGLQSMFGVDVSRVEWLLNQAKQVIRGPRSSQSYLKLLRDNLPYDQKQIVINLITLVVKADGVEKGFETYLMNKFSSFLEK